MTEAHLPGCENVEADFESRAYRLQIEWRLDPYIFQLISAQLGSSEIDLFVSRVNAHLWLLIVYVFRPRGTFARRHQ